MIIRILSWLFAVVPALAALAWAWLASRFPESVVQRRGLGECASQWDFPAIATVDGEPAHLLNRLAHLSLLHVPGMSIWAMAFVNAGLAILLAMALTRQLRRAIGAEGIGHAVLFAALAMLACSPSYGANWLHGERLGRFAVPLGFVAGLLLVGSGRFRMRGALVLLIVAAAPWFHDRGCFVFLALIPALLGSPTIGTRRMAWLIALLLIGNVAAVATFYQVGYLSLADQGLFGALLAAPGATLGEVIHLTGSLWPDALAHRNIDERVLGLLSWLSPLLLLVRRPVPVEGAPPRASDGPWWSCITFGLLSVLWQIERHGPAGLAGQVLIPQAQVEMLYGGFLLPIGVLGVLASRFGKAVWPLVGGALLAFTAQNWEHGLEALRVRRSQVERVEATVLMPFDIGGLRELRELPTRDLAELMRLEQHGWVPDGSESWADAIQAAADGAPDAGQGTFAGGDFQNLRGTVRSLVFGGQVSCVLIGVTTGADVRAIRYVLPEARRGGDRNVPWTSAIPGEVPEGARVRVAGIDVRNGRGVRLGPTFVVRSGVLVEEGR